MKLTKKQLSALQRIVGREQTRYDEIQSEALAGVHPSEKHFCHNRWNYGGAVCGTARGNPRR